MNALLRLKAAIVRGWQKLDRWMAGDLAGRIDDYTNEFEPRFEDSAYRCPCDMTKGYTCTRKEGHSGPCALWPDDEIIAAHNRRYSTRVFTLSAGVNDAQWKQAQERAGYPSVFEAKPEVERRGTRPDTHMRSPITPFRVALRGYIRDDQDTAD